MNSTETNATTTAAVATQSAQVGSKKATEPKAATRKKAAAKAKTGGKVAGTKKSAAKVTAKVSSTKASGNGRANSKKTAVLDLLRRKDGATLAEIAKATGWQNHYADVQIMPTCVGNPACGAVIAAMKSA